MMEHHSGMENLSVLVLDNDPTSLLLISDRLEQLNFKVFSFQTEHAALDFLKKGTAKEEELDLILAEVHVSTMSSRTLADSELLSHIMNELHVPFVSMCANDDEEAISECMAIGACFHLTKPLTTGSFNMLRHTARQHKSRMTTPEGSNTFYRTVSSSTKMAKETLNLRREELHHRESEKHEEPEVCKERDHSNKPDQLRLKAYGHPKKSNRLVWTVELHEKFLEAIEVLGGKYAVPSRILKQMNVKNLTLMHVASHLQKHRLRQPKANQDWKFQQNVNSKPAPLLVRSEHIAFTTESITPRVAADIREVYPSRLSTNIKKMSAEPAALEAYSYTRTPGIFRNDTMTVWDKYHKSLKNDFYWSSIRHRYEQSAKSKDIARGEGVSSEDPKIAGEMSYGGAPFESPGSNSLLTSCLGQIEKTNLTEIAGNNNNVGNTAVMDPSDALLDDTIKSSSAQMYLTGPADNLEEMNSFWMSQMEGPEGQLNIKPEDLLQVDEAWNEALVLGTKPSLINVVEPMTREATVGFTLPDPVMQFAQTQEAATGDAPMPDPVMQFPQTQEAAAEDAPMPDPVMQFAQTQEASVRDAPPPVLDYAALFAQDDIYCGWSPSVGDYDILL